MLLYSVEWSRWARRGTRQPGWLCASIPSIGLPWSHEKTSTRSLFCSSRNLIAISWKEYSACRKKRDVYSKSRSQIRPFGICRGNPFLDIPVSRASAKRLASCILHGARLQPQSGGVRKLLTSGRCSAAHFTIMLQRLLIRAWDVPLKRMLDFYCPPGKELDDEKNLSLKAYATPFRSVLRFLLRVCKYVVPTEMLTLCSHREYLRKVVRSFLECKANSVPFDSIFHEDVLIQSQDELPSYLSNSERSSQKCFGRDYAGKTLCFLFRAVIAHTFAVCFVVSSAGDADSKRMFLRRDLNMRFYAIASNHLLRSGDFQHLKDTARTREVRPMTSLHFLPKPGGFRVIQSMEHGRTRKQAYLIQSVLMCERLSHPESFGASVRSVAEVYERWRGFAERWRWHGRPKLYAVCFDIRQAFDSIPLHRLLWHELPELFHSNAYGLRRFFCSDGNFRFPRRKWMACPLENVTGGYDAFSHQFSRCSRELILADEGIIYWLRTSDIIAWLRRTVGKNLVLLRNGEGILVQRHGVPQGLPISSLLCDFHLGQFERSCFRDIVCAQNREDALTLMIRYVDDVLFVTSNASLFHSVLARVHQGSETFGVMPSPGKTRVCISGIGTGTVEWCGMILNLRNAEVLLNTPPICRGLGPECRDFLGPHKSSGTKRVIARFVSIFASQIQPIFVDARINMRQTVQSNIYAALNLALCRVDQRGFFAIFESQNNRKKFTHMLFRALVDRLHRLVPTGLHHELSVKYLKRLLYESLHFFACPLDNFRNRPH
ncbi:hypothetical protein F1559_001441 [Cyanidiococcus yangmingshanensis]|uniref:Telomerase reverse transcriptase n=1 Tax=Cyanidiococcus yangmingshanensis TaxID=2690220 RepID=A0A7J7IE94_9RHOD|nr:hypothetical protein F1559_001441 [Cyanidiococcus yangmingshanensis]